ncbi:hypothetical protein [Actinomyces oris]
MPDHRWTPGRWAESWAEQVR